jgi:hypothetical protein
MIGVRLLSLSSLFLFLFTTSSFGGDVLPQSIGSLRLERIQSGEEARQEIDRLHGKQIDFRRGYVGTYGNGRATLWISEYDSEGEAAEGIGKMAQRIQTSKKGNFWHFREMSIQGVAVYFVVGMGQAHYFFQKGERVIWLAVDPPLAREAIRDAIRKIPQ